MDKLRLWQDRLSRNESAFAAETAKMDRREELYAGSKKVTPVTENDKKAETPHVRNICAELIEAQVSTAIPMPKVTARRPQDEWKAKIIEDMLRNEIDRLPFERINDMLERTVPIQGAAAVLLEWDNTVETHTTTGELCATTVHPKQLVPQDGVYSGVEDMDYIILKIPQTKGYIEDKYGVNVDDETESDPDVKGVGSSTSDEMVTQLVAYYRNDNGGIGLYSWVNDTELEDIEDYQARRIKHCETCGAPEPGDDVKPLGEGIVPEVIGMIPMIEDTGRRNKKVCPYCGGTKFTAGAEDFEEIFTEVVRSDGSVIPGASYYLGELMPTKVPYYKPDIYPVILFRSVSVYGKLMGESDIDRIETQQNTTNRLEAKILDKILTSGSVVSLPPSTRITNENGECRSFRIDNPADMNMIHTFDLEANISQDMQYMEQVYQEARQIVGITDSFQGRQDATATSGKAKEIAAAQSAGRLESKRAMKMAAYAELYEAMFKFKLAYTDEKRNIVTTDANGEKQYAQFNRYDFLEQDRSGEYYWNTDFLFSCDAASGLAANREAMWQETRLNLQTGAFGDPADPRTLILFWSKMAELHYPGAEGAKAYIEQRLQEQMQQAQMQQQMAMQQQAMQQMQAQQVQAQQMIPGQDAQSIIAATEERAKRDAMAAAGML